MWDGPNVPAAARLAKDGGESSFAGSFEVKTFADLDGTPMFDVLRYGEGSGAIFAAGTPDAVGAVAYGVVEMTDRRSRVGSQDVLGAQVDPLANTKAEAVARAREAAEAKALAEERAEAESR